MINTLSGFPVIAGFCPKNIRNKSLRIAVIEREPSRLDLHHDAMTGQEYVIGGRKGELVKHRLARSESFRRLQAFPITTAEDVGRDHQLVSAHARLSRDLVGINFDYFDHPI